MRVFVPLLLFAGLVSLSSSARAQERWTAPAEADSLQNPFRMDDAEVNAQGKELYLTWCSTCHGERGDGAGEAGQEWDFSQVVPRLTL
jgi:mono/diheme cytochrome c family protein